MGSTWVLSSPGGPHAGPMNLAIREVLRPIMAEWCIYASGSLVIGWPVIACCLFDTSDSKVHGAHMGPTWGRQDPDRPHVGHVNLAICNQAIIWTIAGLLLTALFGTIFIHEDQFKNVISKVETIFCQCHCIKCCLTSCNDAIVDVLYTMVPAFLSVVCDW